MKYYIGVDLDTSALKLLLVNSEGKVLNTVSKSYNVLSDKQPFAYLFFFTL